MTKEIAKNRFEWDVSSLLKDVSKKDAYKFLPHEIKALGKTYADKRVIEELYYIAEQGNFEFKAMGFVLARRVEELTGSNKLSKEE